MRKIIVEIEREKAEYIERLNFELGFAKDVIQRIIESHPNDPDVINSEAFKAYQKKGAELEILCRRSTESCSIYSRQSRRGKERH